MVLVRCAIAGSLILGCAIGAARADEASAFAAIHPILEATLADTGAPGDALLIGDGARPLHSETAGTASLDTPINISIRTDLAQPTILLALVDAGFMSLDDPVKTYLSSAKDDALGTETIRQLMIERADDGAAADRAANSLTLVAESATGWAWDPLFKQWMATPLHMQASSYTKSGNALQTSPRDYARLLAMLVQRPMHGAKTSPTPASDLIFRSQIIGAASCARQDETALCNLVERDGVGFYAWIDRARGLYGVFAAPGAETSIAKRGREIRAVAEAAYDREQAGEGLTSAINN